MGLAACGLLCVCGCGTWCRALVPLPPSALVPLHGTVWTLLQLSKTSTDKRKRCFIARLSDAMRHVWAAAWCVSVCLTL